MSMQTTGSEKDLFLRAIEIAISEDRQQFLDQACGADNGLRRRVDALIFAHERSESLLDDAAPNLNENTQSGATIDHLIAERPGMQIGPYKLLQQIGEGGMGVVYMAEQKDPVERRVALKIIKPGMDTRQVIARFEAERQALAMMDHPNIAKVLEASTTKTGRPYFIMELVKGTPITQYCDERQLTTRERLELLVPVCQAVQHAHQKGIVHRDLKPSNILVAEHDNAAVPKVIDFGVAKALHQHLTEKTLFTEFGQIIGTLEYMSPEQAKVNQLDIDTRSDIYSLGVLLYELLTGVTPFDKQRLRHAAWDEMLQIIREEEPPRPSMRLSVSEKLVSIAACRKTEPAKLSALLRGELDWIVMKALDKERNRRYSTAVAFAEDIRHYLQDEPVQACPPTTGYRFRKFARRNKIVLGGTAAVVMALSFGLLTTSWLLTRAVEAEEDARLAFGKANIDFHRANVNVDMQKFLVSRISQIEDAASEGWSQLATTASQDPRLKVPELLSLRDELLGRSLNFFNRAIELERDLNGRPGLRHGFYRLQQALTLARLGRHLDAYREAEVLQRDLSWSDEWNYELARICALCAAGANVDHGLL